MDSDDDMQVVYENISAIGITQVKNEEIDDDIIVLDDDDEPLPPVRIRPSKLHRHRFKNSIRKYRYEISLCDRRMERRSIVRKRLKLTLPFYHCYVKQELAVDDGLGNGEKEDAVEPRMTDSDEGLGTETTQSDEERRENMEDESAEEGELIICDQEEKPLNAFMRYRSNNNESDEDIIVLSDDDNGKKENDRKKRKREEKSEKKERKKKEKEAKKERKREKGKNGEGKEKKHHRHHKSDTTEESEREKEERRKKKKEKSEKSSDKSREKKRSRVNGDDFMLDTDRRLILPTGERAFRSDIIQDIALTSSDNPEEANFSIFSLLNGHKELGLRRVEGGEGLVAFSPLGTAYDRVMRMWIYTDTGRGQVVLCSYEGYVKARMDGFRNPSAIAIITPGSHFAVLDSNGITLVEVMTNTKKIIADEFHGRYRGLATTTDGNLVTIGIEFPEPFICVVSVAGKNEMIDTIPYRWISPETPRPSFICSAKEMIYVTDLNQNMLSSYSYNRETKRLQVTTRRDLSSSIHRTSVLKTTYMSGIVADASYNLLVADARGRCVSLCAPDGSLIQTVPFVNDKAHPYIAGISLAPTGRVMICCRKENTVKMYDLVPIVTKEDEITRAMDFMEGF